MKTLLSVLAVGALICLGVRACVVFQNALVPLLWRETSCVVVSHHFGMLFRAGPHRFGVPLIHFKYTFRGATYECARYQLRVDGECADYPVIEKILDRYPSGLATNCYVNPWAPHKAVLKRTPELRVVRGTLEAHPELAAGVAITALLWGVRTWGWRPMRQSDR